MKNSLKSVLKKFVSHSQIIKLRSLQWDPVQFFYDSVRDCNICGFKGQFWSWPGPQGRGEFCPSCMGFARHRLVKIFSDKSSWPKDAKVLHVAPELPVRRMLHHAGIRQITSIDISPQADWVEKQDLLALTYAAQSFDFVVCSHVLEHVNDDRRAMSEIFRVLRDGGKAVFLVPIVESFSSTYENPEIKDEKNRTRHFGQKDHVRLYGRDFRARLQETGFTLNEFRATPEQAVEFHLNMGETVFEAMKGKMT